MEHQKAADFDLASVRYERYDPNKEVTQLEAIRSVVSTGLSEPYSIYVYRYFLYQWGDLCYMVGGGKSRPPPDAYQVDKWLLTQNTHLIQALNQDELVGVIVGKLEVHRGGPLRGYIAMLAVKESCRGQGIGSSTFSIRHPRIATTY